ncbi:probable 4-coumarate--CoA ligase 5 [Aplysia californica]|uniref:Probable 4-coumarate--CoA ligase 5 n=1 Tax=Aplysia californica TaxID=6500 RepID=A0ABM1A8J0_APLCA|nr:probable 4-coumarate--CoA ligase 5 [Aplysia californica]XP_012942881.1 probable 4-coumarate--CoA ligase 5 [Aplysia californica]XP_012942882.1 probable 4-coumarate--CoA ligase 5 [Aplysia californica]
MIQRQLLKLLRGSTGSSIALLTRQSKRGILGPCCYGINLTHRISRNLSVSHCIYRQTISSDHILTSNFPDIDIPKDVTFHEFVFNRCDKYGDKVALEEFATGKTIKYSQLRETCLKVASGLHRLGLRKGDVLLTFSTNNIDFTVLMLACSCIGVWFSPANPTFTPEELRVQFQQNGAVAVFAAAPLASTVTQALEGGQFSHVAHKFVFGEAPGFESFQKLLEDDGSALPEVTFDPMDDVLVLPYSSGTTGLPKGVMLTHNNCVANILQLEQSLPVAATDVALGLLPLYHIYGMVVVQFSVLTSGGQVVYLPKFEPEQFLKCIQEKKVTLAHLVPPLVVFLAKHPMVSDYDITSVKRVVSGAAPLGADISSTFLERHKQVEFLGQGFGLTETSPVTNVDTSMTLGSVGYMIPNTEGKIVDLETQKVLGQREDGEFCVRGPQVMKGYFNNQKATDDMVKPDGWLFTGDIGYYDEKGRVYIHDRLKELIKYKGSQVAPAELEALLLGHSEVADVAVIGKPDENAGELPTAFVVRKKGSEVTEQDIVQFVQERVAPSKRLRGGVQFIDEVPKNPSGKILRRIIMANYL